MFVTMSATNTTKSATNTTKSATNATKSATDATKLATDSATKDGGKADNITVKTKRKFGGNGGKTENITAKTKRKFGGNGGKAGGNGGKVGGNGGINTDESVGYEADIIRYVRLHPNTTQKSTNTATKVPLRTIQRIMPKLQRQGILIRKGSRRLGQWKVID